MRQIARRVALLAAALMIMTVPVLAEDGPVGPGMEPEGRTVKECLLVAMNCDANTYDSIQQSIDRLRNEIGRGTDVYTNDELKRLQDRLDDANRNLNESMSDGA